MALWPLFFVILVLSAIGYYMGRAAAVERAQSANVRLHSLLGYYGWYVALWCGLPCLIIYVAWFAIEDTLIRSLVVRSLPGEIASLPPDRLNLTITEIRNLAFGLVQPGEQSRAILEAAAHYRSLLGISNAAFYVVVIALAIAAIVFARRAITPSFRARNAVERIMTALLLVASVIAVLTTIGIVLSLVFESIAFFAQVPIWEFLFGTRWSPMTAIRADQVGSSGEFGAVPLFTGTILIGAIAMAVAVPVGLMTAIYMTEYAPRSVRAVGKPMLEILAGVPTVVYGFFAALTVAPAIRSIGLSLGLDVASQSALAAGLVMGIMIIPFVSSLSDDVINAVPQSMRDGSYAMGATKAETTIRVLLPAALPGIAASVILAFSKALGETMIVVMAAGLQATLTLNPFDTVTTVTVYISALLTGEQEFDSAKTLASFALGLVLFAATLALNLVALHIVKRYREQYE
jgi:phosphate transport system permease protein